MFGGASATPAAPAPTRGSIEIHMINRELSEIHRLLKISYEALGNLKKTENNKEQKIFNNIK